jgi:hypothetical protein
MAEPSHLYNPIEVGALTCKSAHKSDLSFFLPDKSRQGGIQNTNYPNKKSFEF